MAKVMDHAQYQLGLRTKTVEELRYIIRDAQEAIAANPSGHNAGYYADEVCYAAAEIRRVRVFGVQVVNKPSLEKRSWKKQQSV